MNADNESNYSVNPFVRKLTLTKWQKFQIIVMSITIAPLRFILAFILFAITWICAIIATMGADTSKPAVSVRKALYQFLHILGRIILFVCGFHFKINGNRVSYDEAPILLVVPHSSYWDACIMFVTSPLLCVLSKYENYKIPIFGTLMKATQPILVHRTDNSSKRDTVAAIRQRLSSVEDWPQLVVFPEGTCTNKNFMIRFKLGAFVAGKPIQPVVLRYKNSVDVSTWTEVGPSALYLIWLSLCQIQLNLEVDFLQVYNPNADEKKDPKLFAQNVQEHLAKILQVQCSDYSFEDRQLMKYAKKLKFPREEALMQFFHVSKALGINLDNAKERLKEFAGISSCKRGVVDLVSFSSFLNVPSSKAVQKLFKSLSLGSDDITFYQYVMGYYSLVNTMKKEPVFSNAYNLYCNWVDDESANVKNDTIDALVEVFKDGKISSQEDFMGFLAAHPFHCKLLLLLNEHPYLNSKANNNRNVPYSSNSLNRRK